MRTASLGTLGLSWRRSDATGPSRCRRPPGRRRWRRRRRPRRPWRPAWASRLRAKCTRHLCQVAPRIRVAAAFRSLVVVGDQQLHATQPAPDQRAQELGPEGLGLRRADRHLLQDLAAALVVDGHSHGHRDRDDASGLAHLHVGGVEPQIGPVALQRSIEEAVDLIVDLAAQPGDLGSWNARHAHGLHQSSTERVDTPWM